MKGKKISALPLIEFLSLPDNLILLASLVFALLALFTLETSEFPRGARVLGLFAQAQTTTDSDGDGFSDYIENFIGTDPTQKCGPNAWPPDLNNDGKVDMGDAEMFRSHLNSQQGEANYAKRFDLNADRWINVLDVLSLRPYFNSSCTTPPTPTPTPIPTPTPTPTPTTVPDPQLISATPYCLDTVAGGTGVRLVWAPVTTLAVLSYRVQISQYSDFRNAQTINIPGALASSANISPLQEQTLYFWRAIAQDGGGQTSPGRNFNEFRTPDCQPIPTPMPTPIPEPTSPPLPTEQPYPSAPPLPEIPQIPEGSLPEPPPIGQFPMPSIPPSFQYPSYPSFPSLPSLPQFPSFPQFPGGTTPQLPSLPGQPTTGRDIYAPQVQILSPSEKAVVSGEVEISISAKDNVGISKVEIYINDQLRATLTQPPYTWKWNVDQEPEVRNAQNPFYCRILFWLCRTSFLISAKAYDFGGNVGADSVLVFR